jgi:hypothetical protein
MQTRQQPPVSTHAEVPEDTYIVVPEDTYSSIRGDLYRWTLSRTELTKPLCCELNLYTYIGGCSGEAAAAAARLRPAGSGAATSVCGLKLLVHVALSY